MVKKKDGLNCLNHPRKKKIEYTLPLKKLYTVAPGEKIKIDDIEVAGSRLYTSAAYDEKMVDEALTGFDRVFANVTVKEVTK